MNTKALYNLTYGVYLLSVNDGTRDNACIINTAVQVANNPTRISIAVIKANLTNEILAETGRFNLSALTTEAEFSLFQRFGMQSGRTADKFQDFPDVARSENGLYYLTKGANAFLSLRVVESHDLGSHTLFIGELEDAEVLSSVPSCTYGYYQSTIKKSSLKPPTVKKGWRCSVCGYIYEGETMPEDYICPICKHGPEDFEYFEEASTPAAPKAEVAPAAPSAGSGKKWVCTVCGYIAEGENPPAECPVCHVPASQFKELSGEVTLAAEHEYGIYAKTVKGNDSISAGDKAYILEQLKANFTAECSEVGMYLCMARIAHREGYPEIGLYWEKAAYEEAEHAAKFAELLGEELEPNMKADTKANLAWRVDCEFGATQGKVDLAVCAKKNGLDAIHDTVHEMARDEARHGRALKGLLDRYFK